MTDRNRHNKKRPARGLSAQGIRTAIPALGDGMFALEAVRIRDLFRRSTLAVLSAFRTDRSADENRAAQARLCAVLRERHVAFMPVVGRWPGLGNRGLLLREVQQEQVRSIAAEFELKMYLWSVRGRWAVYETRTNRAFAVGEALRIGGPEYGWHKAVCHPESGALPTARTTWCIFGPDNR